MAVPDPPSDDAKSLESSPRTSHDSSKTPSEAPAAVAAADFAPPQQPQKPPKKASPATLTTATTLKPASPRTSRETSPTRPRPPKLTQSTPRLSRSRKNSQDLSPARSANPPTPTLPDAPSAAAVQRALSATGIPRLTSPVAAEAAADAPRQQRTARAPNATAAQNTANTSRVKSPPRTASASKPASRKPDPPFTTSDTSVSAGPTTKPSASQEGVEQEEGTVRSSSNSNSIRSPIKLSTVPSILEAVQESTSPETPAIEWSASNSSTRTRNAVSSPPSDASQKDGALESESESLANSRASVKEVEDPMKLVQIQPGPRPSSLQSRKSLSSLSAAKTKTGGDGSVRSMTVETETVPSVAQLTVGANQGERGGAKSDGGGTIRIKPSTETIRPKKEKKKPTRKTNTAAGGVSSKADIFEAKVASAVDEADDSDSGETFMYESNPPEQTVRSTSRYHHSRTPSATSMASQADVHGRLRNEAHNSIIGKKSMRSMKFTNSFHNLADLPTDEDSQNARPLGNGTHHIGRWGRNGNHASVVGNDAVFAINPSRIHPNSQGRHSSRPNAPRNGNFSRNPATAKLYKYHNDDLDDDDDDEEAADDERTPLIHPGHAPRNRHSRRPGARYDARAARQQQSLCRSICGWISLGLLIAVLVAAVIVALVLCSKPLRNVHIGEISNVIASEEEVVFDLKMYALNPNIVSIQVESLDMKIFAKSKYVGSTAHNPGYHAGRVVAEADGEKGGINATDVDAQGGIDKGTDPIEEPVGADTMMLEHVYSLDSPLSFSPSPFSQQEAADVGEISFSKPGNQTADDGTERWKTVVQHPFELIVVGQLKYTLPISSKTHSVSVGQGKTTVEPGKAKTGEGIGRPPMPGPVKIKISQRAFVA